MKIYIVTVRPSWNSNDGTRYTDSLWVTKGHAESRVQDLKDEFNRRGLMCRVEPGAWWVWYSEATVTDARLADEPEEVQS